MSELAVDMADFHEPNVEEIKAAGIAARELTKVNPVGRFVQISVQAKDDQQPTSEPISLPANIFRSIVKLLVEIGNGNAVQLVPVQAELTTQQAADLLNFSRPHLIKVLDAGELNFRMVGTHRKVLARDVFAYRDRTTLQRREALTRMVAADEAMGLYDDEPIGRDD
jgi:excisionase family DNA binding protein